MVGPPYDILANPLGAVRSTFGKAIGSGAHPSAFDGKDWGVLDLFRHFLFDQSHLSQVPIINPANVSYVQPNALVRFCGMIQDMLGNEFYLGAYKDGSMWRTNKFMDAKFIDVSRLSMGSSPDLRIWERRLLCCVPVSGVEFEDSPGAKRMRESGHPSTSSESQDYKTERACSSKIVVPDFDKDSFPCLVKIYDSPDSELKLNDVFEFIGVLTVDSEFAAEKDNNDDCTNDYCGDELIHLPPKKVPHLHCIIQRKLAIHDFLQNFPVIEPKSHSVKDAREALLRHLTAILGNDGIAANFMLLHLLSKVHARVDNVAVGKLSLNLTCFSKESASVFGTLLSLTVKNLLPFTTCIPLTVEYLNRSSLTPKKDYQTNRLIPGVLQLAEGSHLIIDETQLETGTLHSVGVDNARLLKILIEFQKVEYDFTYYKMEMPADVQLLIFSEGKSNILPADIVMPFHPSVGSSEVVGTEVLEAWRWYLATARSLPHSVESEMQKVVENDLVAARQADRSLGSQDFSRWLTMGRLISASFGETSLSLEHWQMVKELERQRRERLK